ncbi:MAG: TolC family outer membrane protein [Caulobacterales bacterium]
MRYWLSVALAAAAPVGGLAASDAQADTLQQALTSTYTSNPTLAAARAQARSADEGMVQARSGFLPSISATGSYSDRTIKTRTQITGGGVIASKSSLEPTSYGVQAVQPLFTGGRLIAQTRLAAASIELNQAALRATEQGVLLRAIAAYMDVRRDEDSARIQANNAEVLARQLQAAKDRFEVGEITLTDVAQAEARLAGAEASLAAARSTLEASRATYQEVIGKPPEALEAPPPAPELPAGLAEAVEQAIAANPDLAQLAQAEKIARETVRLQVSTLLPQISVVGSYARQNDQSTRGIEQDVSAATAQVSIPLFEAGFRRSTVRQAKQDLAQARAQTEAVRRQVISDVTAAWNDVKAAERVVAASREQQRAAALALEGTEQELQVGLRTTLDVLNAQQEVLNAQLSVARAERDAYVAAHALQQAMGKLEPQTLGVNAPLYNPDKHRRAVLYRF